MSFFPKFRSFDLSSNLGRPLLGRDKAYFWLFLFRPSFRFQDCPNRSSNLLGTSTSLAPRSPHFSLNKAHCSHSSHCHCHGVAKGNLRCVRVSSWSWSGMVLWLRRRWCSCWSHLWHLVGHPAAFDRSPFQTFSKIQAFGTDSGARTGEAVDKGWQTDTKQWATWFVLDCFSLCIRQVRSSYFSFCSIHRGANITENFFWG